ncbi:hypothetical protein BBJ28_00011424 [Nothophytophthora sp. Chile5]|nr:hypothetical protein BBJ28_00011424 [Nothophytophthora sp. Chile5]
MAEALYRLGDALAWTPATAPRGQLVLLQDAVEASGAFLVHHFSALFLKAGHRVCLVANANSPEHYAAVGRKLVTAMRSRLNSNINITPRAWRPLSLVFWMQGVNFAAVRAKNQLEVLDLFQSQTEMDLATLFATLQTFCSQEQVTGSSGVSIVVDDLSAFKWRFGADAVLTFVRCCKTLAHAANVRQLDAQLATI